MTQTTTAMETTTEHPSKESLEGKNSESPDQATKCKSGHPSQERPTLKLTKSCSASKSHPRRSRTLKRWVDFRNFEEGDIKYLWAAYKKDSRSGILNDIPEGLSPDEFKEYVINLTIDNLDFAWTVFAPNKKDLPVGVIYGKDFYPSILLGHMTWFPWSSSRNILEGVLNFINKMRKDSHLMGLSTFKDKRFFEQLCRYGVIAIVTGKPSHVT